MAVFEYKGIDKNGRNVSGVVDADSPKAARTRLKQQGIFPSSLTESRSREKNIGSHFHFASNKVGLGDLSIATRQMSTLIGAGIPIVESLKALTEQLDNERLKRVISEVADRVNEGSTLASALKEYPRVFPALFCNMVASGEASGTLDIVLERLSELLESQAELKRKLVAAAVYPALMLFLCFVVVLLLLAYVVPQITEIFDSKKQALPLPTEIVITLSNIVQGYWWAILLVIVGGFFSFRRYANSTKGREKIDRLKLTMPFLGPINIKIATGRIARTLGTMLESGVELLAALAIVRSISGNVILESVIDSAITGVREGRPLATELGRSGIFPKLLTHLVGIGEKTGRLEEMLMRVAKTYESEINAFVSAFTKILEPFLILFLAVVVGGILAAVMLPMLEMSSLSM